MTSCEIIPYDREHAAALLAQRDHLVQNSDAWHDFIAGFSGEVDRSVSIATRGRPVGFLRALQYKKLIQSLPYPASYAGLFLDEDVSSEAQAQIWAEVFAHYSRFADVFSICTSPFGCAAGVESEQFDYRLKSTVLYIDLEQDLLSGTDSKFRNNLKRNCRKAVESGVTVSHVSDDDTLAQWYQCYSKRMVELGGTCLPQEFFSAMRDGLEPAGHFRLWSALIDKQYLGGIIVVYNSLCADYYLAMFDREYAHCQAGTYLFYELLKWVKNQNIRILNLQASPTGSGGLQNFKNAWGAQTAGHHYLVKALKNREAVESMSPDEIATEYPFHFVLPFSALKRECIA